jgi:hypothetical protein
MIVADVNWWEDEDVRAKYLHGYPKKMPVDRKFRLILRLLRQDFPPEYPVRVRRVGYPFIGPDAPEGDCGLANENKPPAQRYFLIRLAKCNTWKTQFETLLHEWAHCLTWGIGTDHNDIFHRKYGILYRKYIED